MMMIGSSGPMTTMSPVVAIFDKLDCDVEDDIPFDFVVVVVFVDDYYSFVSPRPDFCTRRTLLLLLLLLLAYYQQ